MNDGTLAIIIPAYRAAHLGDTLRSLAAQTDHSFRVYVGDDASPEDLRSVVAPWEEALGLSYRRFEDNLGGASLFAQHRRCMDLAGPEEWVCFLSDDNALSPRAVARIRKAILRHGETDLFHWNADIIDGKGEKTGRFKRFPRRMDVRALFRKFYCKGEAAPLSSFVFRRSVLEAAMGEGEEDAYRRDGMLVLRAAEQHGVRTVCRARLLWRSHPASLSGNPATDERIILSDLAFLRWSEGFFGDRNPLSERKRLRLMARRAVQLYPSYSFEEIKGIFLRSALFAEGRNVRRGTRMLKAEIEVREEALRK